MLFTACTVFDVSNSSNFNANEFVVFSRQWNKTKVMSGLKRKEKEETNLRINDAFSCSRSLLVVVSMES